MIIWALAYSSFSPSESFFMWLSLPSGGRPMYTSTFFWNRPMSSFRCSGLMASTASLAFAISSACSGLGAKGCSGIDPPFIWCCLTTCMQTECAFFRHISNLWWSSWSFGKSVPMFESMAHPCSRSKPNTSSMSLCRSMMSWFGTCCVDSRCWRKRCRVSGRSILVLHASKNSIIVALGIGFFRSICAGFLSSIAWMKVRCAVKMKSLRCMMRAVLPG
mmetsp:Transcript_65747/g.175141  ORF Transcript_65747/g.175141 Transcript_65747/m.175141 type:complete len:218 (-) Transcript_65747:307-960(-)